MKPVWRWTPKCVPSTADNDRRCYYLMATRGLKSRAGALSHWRLTRASSGWSAAGPSLSTADAQSHPSFKYVPQVKRIVSDPSSGCRSFIGASCWACWWCSSANCASSTKAKSLSWSPGHADGWDLVTVAAQRHFRPVSPNARARAGGFARRGGGGRVAGQQPAFSRSGLPRVDAGHRQRARAPDHALEEAGAEFRRFSKRFAASSQKRARRSSIFILTC